MILFLVCLSALFSGLTLGLMGLDTKNLELLTMGPFEDKNAEKQAAYAKKILPLRKSGNLLLCTLLLGNVAVNALLSIFLADLTSGLIGFFASTVLIVVFGEITPQSICSRYGLAVGAYTVWVVRIFILLLYVIAKPIALILDCILGEELGNILSKEQMKKLFEQYEKDQLLNPDERKLMTAALEIQDKKAKTIMTPMNKIYLLDINTKLTEEKIHEIYLQGFSRIPIFDGKRDNVVGILLVRDLLVINNKKEVVVLKQLGNLIIRDIIAVDADSKLEPILKEFKKGTSHLCLVRKTVNDGDQDPYYKNLGIISLEDIIEEILQDDIEDEIDQEKNKVRKGEGVAKQKLLDLFSEKKTSKVLSDNERNAITSYLSKFEEPFKRNKIPHEQLEQLVTRSEVLNVHSSEKDQDSSESEDEKENEKNGIINLEEKKVDDLEKQETDDITIIKSSKLKSNLGHTKHFSSSSALKPDDINLKFNPKFKSKTQVPHNEMSIPEASQESNYFEQSESERESVDNTEQNETKNELRKHGYSDEDSSEEERESPPVIKYDDINPNLYVRNAPSDNYYLILRGKVEVVSGKDGFKVEIGSFSSLGQKALLDLDYKPDFSAKVKGSAKLLRIKRSLYMEYLR